MTITGMTTITTEKPQASSLIRLMAWLSPAMPIGAFSYSHGLERAVHDGLVADAASLRLWLCDLIGRGSIWNDAVLAAEAWRRTRAGGDVAELTELGEAMAGSAERQMETMLQGGAFDEAVAAWEPADAAAGGASRPYPVALGAAAARHGVALSDMLAAFLHGFVVNQAQAAIRLSLIGQSAATALVAAMEAGVLDAAARAARSSLDDLGGCAFLSEIAAMNHETQHSRLFRT